MRTGVSEGYAAFILRAQGSNNHLRENLKPSILFRIESRIQSLEASNLVRFYPVSFFKPKFPQV
jgi:hypothetical protein